MVDSTKKDGLIYPNSNSNLTNAEKEVLKLITEEFLTLKQIQLRRDCSKQAVYKIIKSLKKKGVLNQGLQQVDFNQSTSQPKCKNRLHGQEINIKIINKSQKYLEIIKKSNLIIRNGHTIRLYSSSIEIYSGEGISFLGTDEIEATRKSLDYWKKFIVSLENEFKVILLKNRVQNIKIVNHHYAYTDSEVCKDAIEHKTKIKVFAIEDGKLAFITDDSFGLNEDECVHPEKAKQDREAISRQVNDWRLNPEVPTNSELSKAVMILVEENTSLRKDLNYVAKNQVSHVRLIEKASRVMDKLEKKLTTHKLVKLDEIDSSQNKLNKYF